MSLYYTSYYDLSTICFVPRNARVIRAHRKKKFYLRRSFVNPRIILVIAVAIVMLWFALGTLYNIRRGEKLLRWMQKGLPRVGERTTFRWLGSSVAELIIAQGKGTTRRVEILVALAPRDLAWNWLLAVLRGRRDVVILRVDLSNAPRLALELANPKSWTGRLALNETSQEGWQSQDYQGLTLAAPAGLQKMAEAFLEQLQEPLSRLSARYDRVGLRKETPHLEVHLPFPDIRQVNADQFFAALQELARKINQPG
jgi:hypothetical protein